MVSPRSPSSRGLGHHPFTVSTGVRIPLGTPDFCSIGAVVQLVRISACHAEGRGFESRPLRQLYKHDKCYQEAILRGGFSFVLIVCYRSLRDLHKFLPWALRAGYQGVTLGLNQMVHKVFDLQHLARHSIGKRLLPFGLIVVK